jgi:hypothetical protein
MSRLVARLCPHSDESISAYVLNLSEANGFRSPRWLLRAAGLPMTYATKACDLSRLSALVEGAANIDDLTKLTFWPSEASSKYLCFGPTTIATSLLNTSNPRVCLDCLAEGRPLKRVWDIYGYIACPHHRFLMVDTCPCGRRLGWIRCSPSRCACNRLLVASNIRAPDIVVRVAASLEAFAKLESAPKGGAPVDSLSAAAHLLRLFGAQGDDPSTWRSAFMSKPPVDASVKMVERAGPVLVDWPLGIERWIEEQRRSTRSATALSAVYGLLPDRMRAAHRMDGLAAVIESVRAAVARGPDGPLVKSRSFFSMPVEGPAFVRGSIAAQYLGVTSRTVAAMIADGRLQGESRIMGKRRAHLVRSDTLTDLIELRGQLLSAEQAGFWLGISDFQVSALRRHGILPARKLPGLKGELRYELDELKKLIERMSNVATSDHCDNLVPLTDISARRDRRFVDIVHDILSGRVRVSIATTDRASVRLADLRISADSASSTKFREGIPCVTGRVAARRLKINVRMIPVLIQAGCLELASGRTVSDRCSITMASIERFASAYTLASGVAKKHRTGTRQIVQRLKASGVCPVVPSDSRAGISSVWRYTDVTRVFSQDRRRGGRSFHHTRQRRM